MPLAQQTQCFQIRSTATELFGFDAIYDTITGLSVTLFDGLG
jgi:hypothetical protein